MSEPLYLHYELLARGELDEGDSIQVAMIPYRDARVAVVFRSKTEPYNARIAVIKTCSQSISPVFTVLEGAIQVHEEEKCDASVWGGTWSPDGRLLVVYGFAARPTDGKPGASVWILTQNEWIDDGQVQTNTNSNTPMVVRVDVRSLLVRDASWKAAGAMKQDMHAICSAFFPTKSTNRCFLVTRDGWILKMETQVASILMVARSNGHVSEKDIHSLVNMATVTRLTNWHAGVTAVAFEPRSSTLVISGGLQNPSAELRAQGASSLSTWNVTSEDPFAELLDYTMVMGSSESTNDFQDVAQENSEIQVNGIMTKMRHSLLNPLKMLHGDEEDGPTLPGSISHLAISPGGFFLSIVSQSGHFCVRQIDTCADVVPWQFFQHDSINEASQVASTVWLSSSTMGFLTPDHRMLCGFLASSYVVADGIENSDGQSTTVLEIVSQGVEMDQDIMPGGQRSTRLLNSWTHVCEGDSTMFVLQDLSIVKSSASVTWQLSAAQSTSKVRVVQSLIDAHNFERAFSLIQVGEPDDSNEVSNGLDFVYQQIWTEYRRSATVDNVPQGIAVLDTNVASHGLRFENALLCLNAIKVDKNWVASECVQVVASDSLLEMKEILATGLRAIMDTHTHLQHGQEHAQLRATLLRYLYRLTTLNDMIIAELDEDEKRVLAQEQCFDGAVFATFRDAPIVDVACAFAKEGRVEVLSVLFRRNGFNLLPRWTEILDYLPPTTHPHSYAHLLPAIGPQSQDEWQFYSLAPTGSSDYSISEVQLLLENRTHDLSADEGSSFELCARKDPNQRRDEYALWFTHRMVELDSMYGQLGNAFELGRCGQIGLLGAGSDNNDEQHGAPANIVSSTPFEEFLHHSDRLFKCVHTLNISGCCGTSLEDWSLLSLHDQIMAVVIEERQDPEITVDELLQRLRLVFLEPRRHDYALDDLVSWLCQVLLSTRNGPIHHDSLRMLELCAQLINQSNPANPAEVRWIQDDARLLRTAIDVVYSASFPNNASGEDSSIRRQKHQQFVDTLWLIFQSLPERKPTDPPTLAQLQVEVDGMEDLMIAMDLLANYSILMSPAEIRDTLSRESPEKDTDASSNYALQLIDEMCTFGLQHNIPWTSIWQDSLKLKSHVFGERVTQEDMLSLLLRRLLALYKSRDEESHYVSDAQDLIANWVSANVNALPVPMDILAVNIGERIDRGEDDEATRLVDMAQSVLAIPAVATTAEAQSVMMKFQSIMVEEKNYMSIRELMELLTYGAVKVSRTRLRSLRDELERLDLILEVFTSNPSNYKMSAKAEAWLRQELNLSADEAVDIVLDGVMHLANLLRIQLSRKTKIVLKAAYSALYCLDYDTAHRLATKVVHDWSGRDDAELLVGDEESDTVTLFLSLVLDLVSASSFRSWSKKIALVRELLAMDEPSLWGHGVADLLFQRLHKLEAIQGLAIELGLSESDLEDRREQDQRRKLSAEDALLKELEIIVDLLREESGEQRQTDREFVLRLLQKGYQLFMIVQTETRTPLVPSSPSRSGSNNETDEETHQWMIRVVSQMSVIVFEEAHRKMLLEVDDWKQTMETGFSYLVFLSSIDSSDAVDRVWSNDIFRLCSWPSADGETALSSNHEAFVLKFVQFFEYLSASDSMVEESSDLQARRVLMENFNSSSVTAHAYLYNLHERDEFDEEAADEPSGEGGLTTKRQLSYLAMAKQCEQLLQSQKKSQELEAVSSFLNDDVDLERFSLDADYRLETIRRMSTRREQLPVAKEFASKYGVDEYECVLAYIWHAFFPDHIALSSLSRQEQLEQAFRGTEETGGDDFLEQALQRPLEFGEFLLHSHGVFESLPGIDHVGILLVLRMVLECSKRTAQDQESQDSQSESRLPLSKSSSDRVTLLFMCLKRLKEISGSSASEATPDFKLVCGSRNSHELLYGAKNADEARTIATAAIAPFLTSKNIKMLTKVLQKLHQMSPSAIVMVYLDATLSKIWQDHQLRNEAPNADLAAYAYESCMPFLSVLTIDHLTVFHNRFVLGTVSEDASQQFYGQQLVDMGRFGMYLSAQKRLEVVSDNVTLFQSRLDSLKSSTTTEETLERHVEQLRVLDEQLIDASFWFVVDTVSQYDLLESEDKTWLGEWTTRVKDWFGKDRASKADYEDQILNAFVIYCERAKSLDLATLLIELALGLTSPQEFVTRTVQDIYCKGVSDVIHKALTQEGSEGLADEVVGNWASKLASSSNLELTHPSLMELTNYISSVGPQTGTTSAASDPCDEVFRTVLVQLESIPSPLVRAVATKRKEKLSATEESSSLRNVVIDQWKAVIAQYEEQRSWMTCALLSYVLVHDQGASPEDQQYDFGLRVKALCEWLRLHYHEGSWTTIFELPTAELYTQFSSQVFQLVLSLIESCKTQAAVQPTQQLTVSLAVMLRWFEELDGTFRHGEASEQWKIEKEAALIHRLGVIPVENASSMSTSAASGSTELWESLLTRGVWDERLMQWYTFVAYDKIKSPDAIAEYIRLRAEDHPALAIMLLLVCPYPELREQQHELILTTAREQLMSPLLLHSTKVRLLELLLLRLDLQVLLSVNGIESVLLAFYTEQNTSIVKRKSLAWTSSVEYYVCQLMNLREYAAASRLVCVLWNVHPMLWDLENGRLVLGNYLATLANAASPSTPSSGTSEAIGQARIQAYEHYKQELVQ